MNIKLLDQDLVNKIAAGEVIERPASAVKELIENALDAGSTSISIDIGNAGKEYIKVSDNGNGMSLEDAKLCIQKHATSKLSSEEDLFKIATLGFRGEALSSMAAVSKMEIKTKRKEDLSGYQLEIENGEIIDSKEAGLPEGTSIELYNLFYNTPARKNYLKDDATELRHITDITQKYALSNQNVSFKLVHNDKILINAPSSQDPMAKIVSIFGHEFGRELIRIDSNFESEDYPRKISGYIGKPQLNRSDKSNMITFVNGRFVKNQLLADSIFKAYDTMLNTQRYPVSILNFELPIDKIDVNVHPSKTVIKIQKELDVADWITSELRKSLTSQDLVPKVKPKGIFTSETLDKFTGKEELPQTDLKKVLESFRRKKKEGEEIKYAPRDQVRSTQEVLPEVSVSKTPLVEEEVELDPINIIGIIHKTYVLIETRTGLRIVDQHAADERVRYERFKKVLESRSLTKQNLLEGTNIELTSQEKQAALQFKNQLSGTGFDFDEFGGNTIILRTLPSLLGKQQGLDLFRKTLESFIREGVSQNPIKQMTDNFLKTMGCRSAIKAGDRVENLEIRKILKELETCENKFTCPHGRPVTIELTIKEFERLFNRERGHESVA
jgi:DNA mismatch repair protein MutL